MSIFDTYPNFLSRDHRTTPISNDSFHRYTLTQKLVSWRCNTYFPNGVKDKSILDIGCATGIIGLWCMAHGAKCYTGVDYDSTYITIAKECFDETPFSAIFYKNDALKFMKSAGRYDIVIASGINTRFENQRDFFDNLAPCAKETIIVESNLPGLPPQFKNIKAVIYINSTNTISTIPYISYVLKNYNFIFDNSFYKKTRKDAVNLFENQRCILKYDKQI